MFAHSLTLANSRRVVEAANRQRFPTMYGLREYVVEGGLISEYRESVNGGVAMVQLGVAAPRIEKVLKRWAGWLRERPEVQKYLKR